MNRIDAMARLFDDSHQDQLRTGEGRVVALAPAANVWGSFDYLWAEALGEPASGQRVRAPFGRGNRKTLAFVVDCNRRRTAHELKAVTEVIDPEPQFDKVLWDLGQWISRYYMTPLGLTLAAMIPSAVGRFEPRSETVVFLASERRDWPRSLGPRQRRVLDELLEARKQGVEPLGQESLLHHSGASGDTVQRLRRRNLIRLDSRPVVLPELTDAQGRDPFELNQAQKEVLAATEAKLAAGFSATLLYGVTASGKTEVYIRAIRKVVTAGRQAILLVPEIALATQTLSRLLERLPRVAVLHSALTDSHRAFYYQQIRDGHASVVVGPRSAVFAPTRKLGLIIVDEEHEATYKQDTAPRYHGRDVAVMRAKLTGVPVLLGSATPSLESFHNVSLKRYDMLRLPDRIRGLPMPKLQIVHLRREITPGRVEMIGRTLTRKMAAALDRGEQIILLLNRRGYASYVFCPKCKWVMSCQNCTRAMVFHQATQLVLCHYCGQSAALPECCPACSGKLLLFGFGIQRIEGELARKFPTARVARMDSDTMTSPKQFQKVFQQFATGDLDLLLGTQMVAKGLDFPRVSLVGVISADTSLNIPDFRAAERTFQLVVQVAGRAGRADLPGEVVVQTLHGDEPAIRFAAAQDFDAFAEKELYERREAGYPPFSRIVRFIIRHKDGQRASDAAAGVARRLRELLPDDKITIIGPQPALVKKIREQFRFQVLLITRHAGLVQQTLGLQMRALCREAKAEVIADVDPVNLM